MGNIIVKRYIATLVEYDEYDGCGVLSEKDLTHDERFRDVVVAGGICVDVKTSERYMPLDIKDGLITNDIYLNQKYIQDLIIPPEVTEKDLIEGIKAYKTFLERLKEEQELEKDPKILKFPKILLYKNEQ